MDPQISPGGEPDPRGVSRRGFLVVSGAVVTASSVGVATIGRAGEKAAGRNPAVPTFQQVNGYALGSKQASTSDMDRYVDAVVKASNRVKTEPIGTSVEGRVMRIVIVSHPDNLARLDYLERTARSLRDRPTTADAGAKTASQLPAFVIMLPNVHGNEPAGSDSLMQVLYDVASGTDAKTERRLRELVIVMMVTQNPDGREGGHRTSARGFDLNRDWFSLTQPETPAKIALNRRFPAIIGMDLHEQFLGSPDSFYFPPNADPIHAESSRSGLVASNKYISPAMEKAFNAKGYKYTHYGIYDLFAPIYGDSVPNLAFGGAGYIIEMENENLYQAKFDRTYTSADALVDAAAVNRAALYTAWARQWPENRDRGKAGILAANIVQNPGAKPALKMPNERVFGYALRPTRRKGDIALLVDRLLQFGVEVFVTTKPRKTKLRPFGGGSFGQTTLSAGTVIVSAGQPMKHWIHCILADDPHASVNYFYDVSGWSNPLMMALDGGAIGTSVESWLTDPSKPVKRVTTSSQLAGPTPQPHATAYAFAADTAVAQRAVFALLRQGIGVLRAPSGSAIVAGKDLAAVVTETQVHGIPLTPVAQVPSKVVSLRRPKVALVHDLVSDTAQRSFARSSGFAQWLLATKLGLDVTLILANQIDAGFLTLGGYDALVVPAGFATVLPAGAPNADLSLPGAGLTPLGLAEINLFVRQGGTYLGWGAQGITTAMAAGVAGNLRSTTPLSGLLVPGSPFAVEIHDGDPATLGLAGFSTVFNVRDPILTGGGKAIVTYPQVPRSFGYSQGAAALAGTVAATALEIGKGRSYIFSFDPAYRGWTEATQALVGNALLAPPNRSRGLAARPVRPDLLDRTFTGREVVIRVERAHESLLRAAVAGLTGAPVGMSVLDVGPEGFELRAPDSDPLGAHVAGWVRRLLAALDRVQVRPTLVIA